jgi:hypothetical protein
MLLSLHDFNCTIPLALIKGQHCLLKKMRQMNRILDMDPIKNLVLVCMDNVRTEKIYMMGYEIVNFDVDCRLEPSYSMSRSGSIENTVVNYCPTQK